MGTAIKNASAKRRLESVDDSDPSAVARAVAAAMVEDNAGRKPHNNIVRCAFEGCEKTFKGVSISSFFSFQPLIALEFQYESSLPCMPHGVSCH